MRGWEDKTNQTVPKYICMRKKCPQTPTTVNCLLWLLSTNIACILLLSYTLIPQELQQDLEAAHATVSQLEERERRLQADHESRERRLQADHNSKVSHMRLRHENSLKGMMPMSVKQVSCRLSVLVFTT